MESKTITVCLLVAVLGIAAAVAGFAAEATKAKKSDLTVAYNSYGEPICEYPSSPTMALALAAAAMLVLARIIITSTTGGCCSCCRTIPNLAKLARVCIVISWITSVVAVLMFLGGAKLSSRQGSEQEVDGEYYCYTVRSGIFSGAAIMGLVSVFLGLVYYLFFVSAITGAVETSKVERELEAPPIVDAKKPPINHTKKPPMPSNKQ